MSFTRNKELNKILKRVAKQGFRIKESGGHLKVYAKDKNLGLVTIAHSPKSCSTKMVVNDLKKIGAKL